MKNLLLLALCTISFLSCEPDKKPMKYKQLTFDVVNGKLIKSSEDFSTVIKSSIYKQELSYSFCLDFSRDWVDSTAFDNIYFAPQKKRSSLKLDSGFTATYIRTNKTMDKTQNGYIQHNVIAVASEYSNNVQWLSLPTFIDSTERSKNWSVIFPYHIKGKEKCLIIYDLDTVLFKPPVRQDYDDRDPVPYPPLDSIYHFP